MWETLSLSLSDLLGLIREQVRAKMQAQQVTPTQGALSTISQPAVTGHTVAQLAMGVVLTSNCHSHVVGLQLQFAVQINITLAC